MESKFDNVKDAEFFSYIPNLEKTEMSTPGKMMWNTNDNDNLNNTISEGVTETTTNTNTTSTSANNEQLDDNLLNSSNKIDLNQKLSPLVGSSDDNSLHHASTEENNGEEFLTTGGYDNKNGELFATTNTAELDNNDEDQQHHKIFEKNHHLPQHQQLVDADGDYGPETCVDVTDDVVMVTENSADTNNLSEQSTLSHSKDTLPSSDNCNPFDNKNALDMEENNEFELRNADVDAHIQLDDANKATPLLSPEVEDLPLSSDGQMHFTNEGYQQSPLEDEIPVGIGCNQNKFEDEFMQSNGHLSPAEMKDNEVENEEKLHEEESKDEIDELAKLERFGELEQNEVEDMSFQKPELVENFFGNPTEPELVLQEKELLFNNMHNDENDFRLKDEEEVLEKHVVKTEEFAVKESEPLDLGKKEQIQHSLHNLEIDILEEKPILTGNYLPEDIDFDESPSHFVANEEEKQVEYADEKQDKEEFSEKEDKVEEKLSFVEQKSTPTEEIELEQEDCIHLEEDVRPSDYLAMIERQKEEQQQQQQQQQLGQLDEGFEKDVQFEQDDAMIKSENENEKEKETEKEPENSISEDDNKIKDEMLEKEKEDSEEHLQINENEVLENIESKKGHFEAEEFERITELQKQLQQPEESEMIDNILENKRKLESEAVSLIEEQISLIEDSIVQPEKQCFEEPEKIQDNQGNIDFDNNENVQTPFEQEQIENQLEEKNTNNTKQQPDEDIMANGEEQLQEQNHTECLDEEPAFDEIEKQLEENTEKQLQDSHSIADDEHELENENVENIETLDKQTDEEMEKQLEERTEKHLEEDFNASATLEQDLENKDNQAVEEQLDNSSECQDEEEEKRHMDEQTIEEIEKQLEENTEKQATQDSKTLVDEIKAYEMPEHRYDDDIEEETSESCVEDIDKQVQDLAEFVEDLENKHSEEMMKLKKMEENALLECTEEQLEKIEQQVLDAALLKAERSERVVQQFEEPEIDPENMVEVEEPLIVKEQVPIKPSVVPVSAQEPSAVQPTHDSCGESEDEEWKYTNEGQGEKQLGLQGDTVVEEELPQELEDAGVTFSINERKASENILQQQITLNTSNLIESINDTFEGLTQNITELADQAAAAVSETKEENIVQGIQNLNLSQSSTREKLDNIEDEEDLSASEMNSRLNPEAKEFVPTFSPPSATTENGYDGQKATAIPSHFKDELISQSPRKGRESNMEDINIPAENEFEEEIAHKPHGLPGDEAIIEPTENGGGESFQEMNWKEAMHGSEKEEGPLIDSPVTDESLEIVDNQMQYAAPPNVCELSAPVDLDNAGMKQSIYIENNTSNDDLNAVQVLPIEDIESGLDSIEAQNKEAKDIISNENVQEILDLASNEKIETTVDEEIEQKMEQLLLSHDKEFTKDVKMETEEVPINGVEMAPEVASAQLEQIVAVAESVPEQPQEPSAPAEESAPSEVPANQEEAHEEVSVGVATAAAVTAATAAAVTAAAATAAVKKTEDEKNQKNLKKTSSATKSKVPDTKKPPAKTSAVSSVAAAKRTLADKPKPAAAASSLTTKKTVSSTTSATARPRSTPATAGAKTPTEKKTTSTTSTVKSRIDAKPPTTLATRKPLSSSSATKTTTSKPGDETKSGSSATKSSTIGKSSLGSKPSLGSTRPTSGTNSIAKSRPATATSTATTNGTASKTAAAAKSTTLAPKSAAKPLATSPRGTLTSTLRKTEAVKSPTKTTSSSTITSRVSTNGVTKSTTTTTRTTTTKTTSSTVPTARTTTTRLSVTGTTTGSTTPTSKTNNLLSRKSTPLKKTTTTTNSSTTPNARKSIASKLNSPATKPTKDTSSPRPVTIPAQHQQQNSIIAEETKINNDAAPHLLPSVEEPKLNGNASPDDVLLPTSTEAAPVAAHPLIEMETA